MVPLRNAHRIPHIVNRKICINYAASSNARAYFKLVFTRVLAISRTRVPCRRRVLCPTGWARLGIQQMEDPRRPQPPHLSHPEQIAIESAAHECCKCNAPSRPRHLLRPCRFARTGWLRLACCRSTSNGAWNVGPCTACPWWYLTEGIRCCKTLRSRACMQNL